MDISKLVTKEELKKEIKGVRTDLKTESRSLRGEILRVEEKVEKIQDEIKEIKADGNRREDKLDRLQNTLDGFVGRVDDLSVDNEVGTHQTRELELKVESLEQRVKQLESSKQAS